jgi:hypothetical protein
MLKSLISLVLVLFVTSCSQGIMGGNIEKNLEATDKIYGRCDNPYRSMTNVEKEICRGKVAAAGPDGKIDDPISLNDIFDRFNNPNKNIVYGGLSVNQYLWQGSLSVLENYPLQTVDSQGGFISTDWITSKDDPSRRCQIKINVISQDFISTGVKTKLLCQEKDNDQWYPDNTLLVEEEKKITLTILEKAQELSNLADLS